MSAPVLTKIVATVGPSSTTPDAIGRLIEAGVSIFRLNFGHGTLAEHEERVRTIRSVAAALRLPTAILGDLQGPRIRLGPVPDGGVEVATGSTVVFTRDAAESEASGDTRAEDVPRFTTTYEGLVDDVEPGQRLLVNDGAVRMLVTERGADGVRCIVTHGGLLTTGKGLNLPETDLRLAIPTDQDWEHVHWAVEHDLDYLALSFVRTAGEVSGLQEGILGIVRERGKPEHRLPVIAKIEAPKALEAIHEILAVAGGIMVARGDLGVEMDLAQVPVIQKRLVALAQDHGVPCIIATQMLESMITAPSPTRAEANDVAGAIYDGADAVMLSAETAVGAYPVIAVEHMRRIAVHTEAALAARPAVATPPARLRRAMDTTAAVAHGAWTIAQDVGARCVVTWSQSGRTARYLSQNNLRVPIVAVTSNERAARQMQLLRGVTPLRRDVPGSLEEFTACAEMWLEELGFAGHGETCLLVAGAPLGHSGATNRVAVHHLGDPGSGFAAR